MLLAALLLGAAAFSDAGEILAQGRAQAQKAGEGKRIAESGIVEGFYGRPWTEEERCSMLHFLGEKGMNLYVYAPKDDPYHREKWREPYPPEELLALKRLAKEADAAGVQLVFAVSPGLDARFSRWAGEADYRALLRKLESVHNLGIHRFAVFFDDIEKKDGKAQARLLNRLNRELLTRGLADQPLLAVPTEYFLRDMVQGDAPKAYTRDMAAELDSDIVVLFTGSEVVPEGVSAEDLAKAERLYHRSMGLWWNYPVTDYLPGKLALGPVQGLDSAVAERVPVFLLNPMEKPRLSRIALATGAAWLKDPLAYDAEEAWRDAIREQYGGLASDMELFALHSRRMDKDWAHIGSPDAPLLQKEMENFWEKLATGADTKAEEKALAREFKRLERAAKHLEERLPPEVKEECLPQLHLLASYAEAGEAALSMFEARRKNQLGREAAYYRRLLDVPVEWQDEKAPRLSEQVLVSFIKKARQWHEGWGQVDMQNAVLSSGKNDGATLDDIGRAAAAGANFRQSGGQ